MASYHHDISRLQFSHAYLFKASRISPTGGSHIRGSYSRLVQAPVHKTGAVKRVGSFSSPYIGRANFGRSYGNQSTCRTGDRCSAGSGRNTAAGTCISSSCRCGISATGGIAACPTIASAWSICLWLWLRLGTSGLEQL